MSAKKVKGPAAITALKVQQWLPTWKNMRFDRKEQQEEPANKHFFLFSMKAGELKALTGVYRRSTRGGMARAKDPNVQRGHEEERSETIRQFVQHGYPWCEMGDAKRKSLGASDLRKPGWLPTAIVVNILLPQSVRNGVAIPDNDLVHVEDLGKTAVLHLPKNFGGANWEPEQVFPLEVIDGQHRLWAFEGFDPGEAFELPVVAFHGLDHGWQAYLFWSVNITPKRINRSLAFDLYPLLRQQSWLDKFQGHSIYRETRCQELVEALWSHPESPWHLRINMLGETKPQREYKGPTVSQAAWIRSLMVSFVKQWEGTGTKIGGLFGPPPSGNDPMLPWNRPMQAAFLIFAGNALKTSVRVSKAGWSQRLRDADGGGLLRGDDRAFYGEHSLISTDQGIRGFLFIVNDLCFKCSAEVGLADWRWENVYSEDVRNKLTATDEGSVTAAIRSLAKADCGNFVKEIADGLSTYDWCTSSTPGLSEEDRLRKSALRGSGGYKELRRQLLVHLSTQKNRVGPAAAAVLKNLGY